MSLDTLTNKSPASGVNSTRNPEPARRRSLAWLLPVCLLIGFACIIALLFGNRLMPTVEVKTAPVITIRLGEQEEASPVSIQASPASSSPGNMIFQASGWIEPDPYVTYVPTLINGVVDKVHVLEGQVIKKGDLIVTLIDDDVRLNLQEAEQKIITLKARIAAHCTGSDIANAELVAAQRKIDSVKSALAESVDNLNRLQSIPEGAVPKQQVVQARLAKTRQQALVAETETEVPRIRARLEQIEFERIAMTASIDELKTARDRAQLALDRTRISSPMDGIVLHLHAAPGKKRMLDMDDPKSAVIVELYDPNKLQARIDVPLTEAAQLQPGQFVELISDILPDMTFRGKVTRISGEADLQRNTLQAKVTIENPDKRLRPEMLLRGKFYAMKSSAATGSGASSPAAQRFAIYIPEAAIINDSSAWVVSSENTAELRQIKLGNDTRDNHHRVLDGLRSGEHVILPPHAELKEGTRLNSSPQTEN